ncbi:thioesterase family protein [Candidatus Uabimicrobium sp. HlEnr_7]|uniref:thioesterase family protein n=1 Tax=Candidatus Uabimicrobium helgolandensis TaxID=3095367 RepID=UPI003558C689
MKPKLYDIVSNIINEKIAFNKVIGIKLDCLDEQSVCLKLSMNDLLVGNPVRRSLHGGVISTVLDVTGGITAFVGILKTLDPCTWEHKIEEIFYQFGTIDLRVDYLRPGLGQSFFATGSLLRLGNKVAVTQMKLRNQKEDLIAIGTATYIVG